jgi:hypothetical protein
VSFAREDAKAVELVLTTSDEAAVIVCNNASGFVRAAKLFAIKLARTLETIVRGENARIEYVNVPTTVKNSCTKEVRLNVTDFRLLVSKEEKLLIIW